ncbi:MAG: ATP-binding protein [Sphaerochaetaceae bacterium]|nr:ATP-binding protein [Sphaerochaetaceae bacterium]
MNETLRLIIAQQQNNLRSQFPIIPRDIEVLSVPRKATVIIGTRRCGKSTWQHEKMGALLDEGIPTQNFCYIDFSDDRLDFLRKEDSDPSTISDTYYGMYPEKHAEKVYFFFDELQYVNRWGQFINRIQTTENCEVYITGSSEKLLSKEIATELAGRTFTWEMFPFSFHEFLRATGKPQSIVDISSRDAIVGAFDAYMTKGGMPERLILPSENMTTMYFQNLVDDVLTRDLILRYNIQHPVQLKRLVYILLNNMSRLISVNRLKQRLAGERNKLSPELISDYMDKLTDCYLMFTVPIRSDNSAIQAVNPKKVYCIDHAIAQAASHATSENNGFVLENMVFIGLRRTTEHIYYYKTTHGNEIDFAVGPDSDIQLIQVCWELGEQGTTRQREIDALLDGMEELALHQSWIITAYEEEEYHDEKTGRYIHVVPAYKWLLNH